MKLKAVINDISHLTRAHSSLYSLCESGPHKGKYVLEVEPAEGFELADVGELRKEEARLGSALEKRVVADAIGRAITEAGGNLTLLAPIVAERLRFDRADLSLKVLNREGREEVNLKGDPASIADLISDLRKIPAYQRAFDLDGAAEKPTESAKPREWGSATTLTEHMTNLRAKRAAEKGIPTVEIRTNPWRAETRNLTEQMIILRADPTRAAQLRAEAER